MTAPQMILQHSPPDTSYGFHRCCGAVRDAVPIEEVARRVFKVTVLPFIDAIIDQRERHQALERAWERWQNKSWKRIAEAVCQGDESVIVALARIYVETQEALT